MDSVPVETETLKVETPPEVKEEEDEEEESEV